MDGDTRRHLADLASEALDLGFERVELEHTYREIDGAPISGWWLRAGRGPVGVDGIGAKFMPDVAFADAGDVYLGEISALLQLWGRLGIPEEDRIGTVLQEPQIDTVRPTIWAGPAADLPFLLRLWSRGTDAQREALRLMLAGGIPPLLLASAAREAFEVLDEDQAA